MVRSSRKVAVCPLVRRMLRRRPTNLRVGVSWGMQQMITHMLGGSYQLARGRELGVSNRSTSRTGWPTNLRVGVSWGLVLKRKRIHFWATNLRVGVSWGLLFFLVYVEDDYYQLARGRELGDPR